MNSSTLKPLSPSQLTTIKRAISEIIPILSRSLDTKLVLTSHIRDTGSHATGLAFDLAPRPQSMDRYAVIHNRDPLLIFRGSFKRRLERLPQCPLLAQFLNYHNVGLNVYVETDHLHVEFSSAVGRVRLVYIYVPKQNCYKSALEDYHMVENLAQQQPDYALSDEDFISLHRF